MTTTVYRIDGAPGRGLWYNPDGAYVGEIHEALSFCQASSLQMPFDEKLVGWRSGTLTPEELLQWISIEEMKFLEKEGFYIVTYSAEETKVYEHIDHGSGNRIPHLVFKKETAVMSQRLSVKDFSLLLV